MINEQLLQYIKSQRNAGTSDEKIKENLSAAGWRDEDIAEGFEAVSANDKTSPQNHQEVRQEATEDRQNQESEATNQSNQKKKSDDKYRESVNKQDQQPQNTDRPTTQTNSGGNDSGGNVGQKQSDHKTDQDHSEQKKGEQARQHSANEDPQPLRTMEKDRERVRGSDNSSSSKPDKTGGQTKKETSKEKPSQQKSHSKQAGSRPEKKDQGKTSGYHPTEATQSNRGGANKQKQSKTSKSKKGKSSNRKKHSKSRSGQKANAKTARNKKQRQRQSRIQEAKKQSASSSISAIILSILVLILMGGGAAYAYLNYFQGPSAEATAQSVMQSLADSQRFEYRIGVGPQTEGDSENEETLVIEGAMDLTSEEDSYYAITRPSTPGSSAVTGTPSELSAYSELDQRQQQTINDTLLQPDFFTVREFQTQQRLGAGEDSPGFSTNRFGVTADPAQLATAYTIIYETLYGESMDEPVASALQERLQGFTPDQGQLWIHPTSSVPYQMTFVGTDADDEQIQVNLQFREHGNEITQPPQTYESRPVASGLAESLGVTDNTDESDLTQTTSTEPSQPTSTDPATTTEPVDENPEDGQDESMQTNELRQQDRLRMNDLQQMKVALQSYAQENGNYPSNLNELASSQSSIISVLPVDPKTGNSYSYAVNQSQTVYHLGATLEATSSQQAPDDADYNSTPGPFTNGFDGSADRCRSGSELNGSTCYDLRGSVSTTGN